MNTLSWLVYLSSIIPNLGLFFGLVSALGIPVLTFTGIIWSAETGKNQFLKLKPWLIVCCVLLFLSVLIPSQNTIYMIMASEMGEAVVTSEEGQEVFNELKDTVMYQLQQLQGEE